MNMVLIVKSYFFGKKENNINCENFLNVLKMITEFLHENDTNKLIENLVETKSSS